VGDVSENRTNHATSADQIKAALDKLGLTHEQASELFRHDVRTIGRWCYGERAPPQVS
jgi:DNA-binding transcriptional regulator YiaG